MTATADISVLIPCFNSEKTINNAILSVQSQTLKPREIIVVDDCSTDATVRIVKGLALHSPISIKLLVLGKNSGPGTARNVAWDAANGEYVAFLDADDQWSKKKIELVAAAIKAKPSQLAFFHDYCYERGFSELETSSPSLTSVGLWQLIVSNKVATPTLAIRRKTDLRFNPAMKFCEDYDLILRLAEQSPIIYIDQVLAAISRPVGTPGGLSANLWAMRKGEMKAYWHLAQSYFPARLALPVLIIWSLAKHTYRYIKMAKRSLKTQSQS